MKTLTKTDPTFDTFSGSNFIIGSEVDSIVLMWTTTTIPTKNPKPEQ